MMSRGVPRSEARLLPMIMPVVIPVVRASMRITPQSAQRSMQRVSEVFREVDERLGDGRRFLVGERFTAADLTFASLASPVLLPDGCRAAYPMLDDVPTHDARGDRAPARHRRRAIRTAPLFAGAPSRACGSLAAHPKTLPQPLRK
jgi:glutathione S-transferase